MRTSTTRPSPRGSTSATRYGRHARSPRPVRPDLVQPKIVAGALSVSEARDVLRDLRGIGEHRFLDNDVSMTAADMPRIVGHRQVTDALLLAVARRAGVALVTFDAAIAKLAGGDGVQLLRR
jgi:predicted nucleic acid-binding protein